MIEKFEMQIREQAETLWLDIIRIVDMIRHERKTFHNCPLDFPCVADHMLLAQLLHGICKIRLDLKVLEDFIDDVWLGQGKS